MDSRKPVAADWTWADQISTYRFWGLLLFYVFTVFSVSLLRRWYLPHYLYERGFSGSALVLMYALIGGSSILGFLLGWLAVQRRTVAFLLTIAVLNFLGGLCLTIDQLAAAPAVLLGPVLVGVALGTTLIAIPALFAGGGRAGSFVVAFGIAVSTSLILDFACGPWVATLLETLGYSYLARLVNFLSLVGIIVLIPVDRVLFSLPPSTRSRPLKPVKRNPVGVFILCFAPIYNLYHVLHWVYRVHGEVCFLAPSRRLLSPIAAVFVFLFVPLMPPIMMATLATQLNNRALAVGKRPRLSITGVFLWSIFLFPLVMDNLQRELNFAVQESPASGS